MVEIVTGKRRKKTQLGDFVDFFSRKNPDHKAEFAHPGDPDFSETKAHAKIKCRYGTQCFRYVHHQRQSFL